MIPSGESCASVRSSATGSSKIRRSKVRPSGERQMTVRPRHQSPWPRHRRPHRSARWDTCRRRRARHPRAPSASRPPNGRRPRAGAPQHRGGHPERREAVRCRRDVEHLDAGEGLGRLDPVHVCPSAENQASLHATIPTRDSPRPRSRPGRPRPRPPARRRRDRPELTPSAVDHTMSGHGATSAGTGGGSSMGSAKALARIPAPAARSPRSRVDAPASRAV